MTRQFLSSACLFFVKDVIKAEEFYRDALGLAADRFWGEPPCFCIVHRDNVSVMLSQIDKADAIRPNGMSERDRWDAYFWVVDADAMFAQAKGAGAEVVYAPTVQEDYGMKEFAIRDIDGYVLAFGQDVAQPANEDSGKNRSN